MNFEVPGKVITLENVEDRFRMAAFAMTLDMPAFLDVIDHVENQIKEIAAEEAKHGRVMCTAVRKRWAALRDAIMAAEEFASAMQRYIKESNTPCPDHDQTHGKP